MSLQFSSSGFVSEGHGPAQRLLNFADAVLRGVGQVMFQNNSYTGLVFLAGIFYNSPRSGLAALVGAAASTAAAMLLGARPATVRDGLFGFNGALVAIALAVFVQPGALTWGYMVFAAAGSTVLMAALLRLLAAWKLPALTAPFVVVALCFLLACARFGRLQPTPLLPVAGLPDAAVAVLGVVTTATVVEGVFNGVAQVFFQGSVVTGGLFVAGLLIGSRRAGALAVLGSLAGLLAAWGLGAAEPSIRFGLFGFNSVLTAIALGGVFFAPDKVSGACALFATVGAAIVFAAVSAALQPLGLPALTLPFVLMVWVCMLAGPLFPRLGPPPGDG